MGQTFSRKEKQTPDEVNKIRAARTEYQDTLTSLQTNVQTDIQNKALTPESGQLVLAEIQKAYTWLQKNPNANLLEVYANRDATTTEITRILNVDKPKKEFQNQILALPTLADEAVTKDLITKNQVAKVKHLSETEQAWFTKSAATATALDFQQEELKLKTQLQEILQKADLIQMFTEKLNAVKTAQPSALKSELVTREQKAKEAHNAEVHIDEGVDVVWKTALKVFFGLLVFAICIFAGSLVANQAIGRSRAYRILYFMYGALPIFVPFVLFYILYSRLRFGPIPYYAILPLTIEPATTRLGRLFLFPFYWIPDDTSRQMTRAFMDSIEKLT